MAFKKILERLEMNNISGFITNPKNMASCMVNNRKVFTILKMNKHFDPQLLLDET